MLTNATRYEILTSLNDVRARLTSDDNLLIYYAGHGELDTVNNRGHWLPVDAEPDSTANWVSNVSITDVLNVIKARQVLLVADSCYADVLSGRALYQAVTARVALSAADFDFEQVPEFAPISRAGHEAGDFFLVPDAR